MSLYAIGDLHFSTSVNKPMNIFGSNWDGHEKKIIDNWKEVVKEEDMVLVLGDTSWELIYPKLKRFRYNKQTSRSENTYKGKS